MKNVLFIAAFVVVGLSQIKAQDTSFGLKGGLNFATIGGDDLDDVDGRTAFHAGFVSYIGLSDMLGFQGEAMYSAQGFSFDDEGEFTQRLDYIQIPLLLDIKFAEGFSAQIGPQFGFLLSSDVEFDGDTAEVEDLYEDFDLSGALGLQYRVEQGIFFQARYNLGFTNIVDIDDADAKNRNIQLSVGYFF